MSSPAGPDGGTPEKPVGLVYIGVADKNGVVVEKNRFIGTRKDIRWRSSQVALTPTASWLRSVSHTNGQCGCSGRTFQSLAA